MVISLILAIYATSLRVYTSHIAVKLVEDLDNLGYKFNYSA